MKPISEFPYDAGNRADGHPMNNRMLLLKTDGGIGGNFVMGYYDAVHDIFRVSMNGHMPNGSYFDETPAVGNYLDHEKLKKHAYESPYLDYQCVMPRAYMMEKGPRCFTHFMVLEDALNFIRDNDLMNSDIDGILGGKFHYFTSYLLCTRDKKLFISEIGAFVEPVGTQFSAFGMSTMNGSPVSSKGAVPREIIRCVADLDKMEAILNE